MSGLMLFCLGYIVGLTFATSVFIITLRYKCKKKELENEEG